MKTLKATRSVRWATFRDELARLSPEDLLSDDVQEMVSERETWPRTDALLSMGEARLSQHIEATTNLCTRLTVWIENHADSSCEPEKTFRSFIQKTFRRFILKNVTLTSISGARASPRTLNIQRRVLTDPAIAEKKSLRRKPWRFKGYFREDTDWIMQSLWRAKTSNSRCRSEVEIVLTTPLSKRPTRGSHRSGSISQPGRQLATAWAASLPPFASCFSTPTATTRQHPS